ncbi:MAG TPA: AraC family transcriptional regulator [Chitinophagaceae bacterium]|nr:AraC family transcriptional regulator [Chitinophagaceae bacterium]
MTVIIKERRKEMEGFKQINNSIDYLEKNLCSNIKIEQVAKVAGVSKYHYQRMFHMLTGVTVAEYIRYRRLTLAAYELLKSKSKVIDVALKYGYSTPESFSKAFQKLHGISPSCVKDKEIALQAYPRFFLQIQVKGNKKMKYTIKEKAPFTIVGKEMNAAINMKENFALIPGFWDECTRMGLCKKLFEIQGDLGLLGVCFDVDYEQEKLTYLSAVEKPEGKSDNEYNLVEKVIPASTWAVFEVTGKMPESIHQLWQHIFSEWFPDTGYQYVKKPDFEAYHLKSVKNLEGKAEIWISIE